MNRGQPTPRGVSHQTAAAGVSSHTKAAGLSPRTAAPARVLSQIKAVRVSHPSAAAAGASKPTAAAGVCPQTKAVGASHPTAAVGVSPQTKAAAVGLSHPTAAVRVSHPTAAVRVAHPTAAVGVGTRPAMSTQVAAPIDKTSVCACAPRHAPNAPADASAGADDYVWLALPTAARVLLPRGARGGAYHDAVLLRVLGVRAERSATGRVCWALLAEGVDTGEPRRAFRAWFREDVLLREAGRGAPLPPLGVELLTERRAGGPCWTPLGALDDRGALVVPSGADGSAGVRLRRLWMPRGGGPACCWTLAQLKARVRQLEEAGAVVRPMAERPRASCTLGDLCAQVALLAGSGAPPRLSLPTPPPATPPAVQRRTAPIRPLAKISPVAATGARTPVPAMTTPAATPTPTATPTAPGAETGAAAVTATATEATAPVRTLAGGLARAERERLVGALPEWSRDPMALARLARLPTDTAQVRSVEGARRTRGTGGPERRAFRCRTEAGRVSWYYEDDASLGLADLLAIDAHCMTSRLRRPPRLVAMLGAQDRVVTVVRVGAETLRAVASRALAACLDGPDDPAPWRGARRLLAATSSPSPSPSQSPSTSLCPDACAAASPSLLTARTDAAPTASSAMCVDAAPLSADAAPSSLSADAAPTASSLSADAAPLSSFGDAVALSEGAAVVLHRMFYDGLSCIPALSDGTCTGTGVAATATATERAAAAPRVLITLEEREWQAWTDDMLLGDAAHVLDCDQGQVHDGGDASGSDDDHAMDGCDDSPAEHSDEELPDVLRRVYEINSTRPTAQSSGFFMHRGRRPHAAAGRGKAARGIAKPARGGTRVRPADSRSRGASADVRRTDPGDDGDGGNDDMLAEADGPVYDDPSEAAPSVQETELWRVMYGDGLAGLLATPGAGASPQRARSGPALI